MSDACICPYTPPETWLSAASCGYGGGYEPGSMQEWDPDCPVHPGSPTYRAGDIAMVDGEVAIWQQRGAWQRLNGATPFATEVGPVLGNVGDIAAAGGIDEINDAAYQRGIDAESFYGGTP